MNDNIEYKMLVDEEIKALEQNDGKMRFEGYLAHFDNVDSYGDVIEKGAFVNTLREAKRKGRTIPVLEQHGGWRASKSDMTPIGYYEELAEDDNGLYAKGVLFNTSAGKEMYTILKESPKGAMGQSIGWLPVKTRIPDSSEMRKRGVYRYIEELKLFEGSIVTFPANEKTRVEDVKTASLFWRQLEDHFRKNDFSREDAKKIVSLIKSSTPEAKFAGFLAQYGNFDVQEAKEKDDSFALKGADELLSVLKNAKDNADIQAFKRIFKDFSLK